MESVQDDCALLGRGKGATNVAWMSSTFAWIVGQAFLCYMPLYWKMTTILYEGSVIRPDAADIYRVLSAYNVPMLFLSMGAARYMKKQDPEGELAKKYKPFSLVKLVFGGAPGDLPTMNWATQTFGVYATMAYGLTEVGGIVTTTDTSNGRVQENQPQLCAGKPIPGINVKILREDGTEAGIEEEGSVVLKFPIPPAVMLTIYKNDAQYLESYLHPFPGYFDLKDNGKFNKDGHLYVLNRNDTIFKADGHRISCTSLEEIMMSHPCVSECVVVTKIVQHDGVPNEIPEGFFLLKEGNVKPMDEIADEMVKSVHQTIGKFIIFSRPHSVEMLPRTNTGKIARGTVQEFLRNFTTSKIVNAPEDPILQSIWKALKST